jgi:lipopolysaccharide transport system ATP-binding protein
MSNTAISIEKLSKCYEIQSDESRGTNWWRRLASQVSQRKPLGKNDSGLKDLHWALRDVSFEVKEGEVVGVIGHNGAGKSTLLRILARITHPTSGVARVRGRMASLLEVGTGFHPDLSGRDNIWMNAAILGMEKRLIASRFDQIVDFSGVEAFIDTPIKHYSSGMKVRLAFSVAAHLDPDILVIDEVLAVGDAAFQKKCLNRIEEVGSSGRTVLFVSHQLGTVARLCSRGIVLEKGGLVYDGGALEALRFYNDRIGETRSVREWADLSEAPGDGSARLRKVEILEGDRPPAGPVDVRNSVGIRVTYTVLEGGKQIVPSVHLYDNAGNWIFAAVDLDPEWRSQPKPPGDWVSTAWIPSNFLNDSAYVVSAALATLDPYRPHCFVHDCVAFSVVDPGGDLTARGSYAGEMPGMIRPMLQWKTARA